MLYYLCIFAGTQVSLLVFYYWAMSLFVPLDRTTFTRYSMYSVLAIYSLAYSVVPIAATIGLLRSKVFHSIYQEHNSLWYQDIGYLVFKTMLYNIFMPPIGFLFSWLFRFLPR